MESKLSLLLALCSCFHLAAAFQTRQSVDAVLERGSTTAFNWDTYLEKVNEETTTTETTTAKTTTTHFHTTTEYDAGRLGEDISNLKKKDIIHMAKGGGAVLLEGTGTLVQALFRAHRAARNAFKNRIAYPIFHPIFHPSTTPLPPGVTTTTLNLTDKVKKLGNQTKNFVNKHKDQAGSFFKAEFGVVKDVFHGIGHMGGFVVKTGKEIVNNVRYGNINGSTTTTAKPTTTVTTTTTKHTAAKRPKRKTTSATSDDESDDWDSLIEDMSSGGD